MNGTLINTTSNDDSHIIPFRNFIETSLFTNKNTIDFFTSVTIMVLLIFCFSMISNDYLIKNTENLVKRLKISPIIGVISFVSLGSSVPEISTNIISIVFSHKKEKPLGVGTLIGSGAFEFTAVLGIGMLFFKQEEHPPLSKPLFALNFIFYLFALVLILTMANQEIDLFKEILMIVCMPVYIMIFWIFLKHLLPVEIENLDTIGSEGDDSKQVFEFVPPSQREDPTMENKAWAFLKKIYYYFCLPFRFLFDHTIPMISCEPLQREEEKIEKSALEEEQTFLHDGSKEAKSEKGDSVKEIKEHRSFGDHASEGRHYTRKKIKVRKRIFPFWLEASFTYVKETLSFPICFIYIFFLGNLFIIMLSRVSDIMGISQEKLGLSLNAIAGNIPDVFNASILFKKGFPDLALTCCMAAQMWNAYWGVGLANLIYTLLYHENNFMEFHNVGAILFVVGIILVLVLMIVMSKFRLNYYMVFVLFIEYVLFSVFVQIN